MKNLTTILYSLFIFTGCSTALDQRSRTGAITEPTIVEAGCGQCQFGLTEKKGCDLAVRPGDRGYFVDNFSMRAFGDPDAEHGMCNLVRDAKVTGEIVEGRFQATSFELLPLSE